MSARLGSAWNLQRSSFECSAVAATAAAAGLLTSHHLGPLMLQSFCSQVEQDSSDSLTLLAATPSFVLKCGSAPCAAWPGLLHPTNYSAQPTQLS